MGLVISRQVDEQVRIGDDITITIIKVDRGRAHLNIVAPRHVRVDRAEIRKLKDARSEPEQLDAEDQQRLDGFYRRYPVERDQA